MPAPHTVLVIDDDPDVRDALRLVLEDNGLRVISAPDGELGITRALQDKPDLVIVDMMMPRVSGFVVLEQLKHHHHVRVPIIMLTANDSDQQREYAEILGVDRYLCKPIRPVLLFETVRKLLPGPESLAIAP